MLQSSSGALMSCSVCLGDYSFVLHGIEGSSVSAASFVLERWAAMLYNIRLEALFQINCALLYLWYMIILNSPQ